MECSTFGSKFVIMIKSFAIGFLILCSVMTNAQEDVMIVFDQALVTSSDTLHITMHIDRDQEVEVAVFTMEQLFVAERSQIKAGKVEYALPLTGIWPSKFVLLIAGESFREEFDFTVKE